MKFCEYALSSLADGSAALTPAWNPAMYRVTGGMLWPPTVEAVV